MAARPKTQVQHVAPAGCAPHERADWLPADLPLPWLQELRTKHMHLANAWAAAVDTIAEARDERARGEAEYRAAVRNAVAQGAPAPARPESLDVAVQIARVSVALEDSELARDDLSECVLTVLAELRAHRAEVTPHLPTFGAALLGALSVGSANQKAILVERLRRQVAELEADGPAIEIFDDSSPMTTPDLEATNA